MVSFEYVVKKIDGIKNAIQYEYKRENYEGCLDLISTAAEILYTTNIYYMDAELEQWLEKIAHSLKLFNDVYERNDGVILFWDGFGLNFRGLIQIYLKALVRYEKVIYVTYSNRKDEIPDVKKIIESNCGSVIFIDRDKHVNEIKQLNALMVKHRPNSFFSTLFPMMYVQQQSCTLMKEK